MEIDWITVSAQIINFLILVWLLKRFLYQPVIQAMDRREQRIQENVNQAVLREQQADEKIQEYAARTAELAQQRDSLLAQAKVDAETHKQQLIDEARQDVNAKRDNWQRQVDMEQAEFMTNLQLRAGQTIQTIARKVLMDLANQELNGQIARIFLDRLKSLDPKIRDALVNSGRPLRINSTFLLEPELQITLSRAIHAQLAETLELEYHQSPELLCGIELLCGDYRLGWNLAGYMDDLETRISSMLSSANTTIPEAEQYVASSS